MSAIELVAAKESAISASTATGTERASPSIMVAAPLVITQPSR
jgi:hypothetical protein